MIPDPPLHVLEAARSRLEGLFEMQGDQCCLEDVAGVTCHQHDGPRAQALRDDPEVVAIADLLDLTIEAKRREREARMGAAS